MMTSGKRAVADIEAAAIEGLGADFGGDLLRPGADGYDDARRLYNRMAEKHPGLIARCSGVADVLRAVEFGRSHDLLTAVRGGGHNVAGKALCDGGLVIDLSRLKGIRVDPARRTVRAQAGVTYGEFDRETQAFGLATTGGLISSTGIAGLTLGGGLGWLMRKHGLACDNLISADVVTADGRVLTASAEENPDLLWGLRGGGGNFGVVTSFEYRLHPVGPVLAGLLIHPLAAARDVLRSYRDFCREAPDELTAYAALMHSPDDGRPILALMLAYAGDLAEGERVVAPLRRVGPPVADTVRPVPYCDLQRSLDPIAPSGLQNYWKSDSLRQLTDEAIDTVISHYEATPSPLALAIVEQLGGAVRRVGRGETAFNLREDEFHFVLMSRWTDPAASESNIRWAREFAAAIRPVSTGAGYVNALSEDDGDRLEAVYGRETYRRLVALKGRYDPTNFFRVNQNIRPTPGRGPGDGEWP
jgi:FAD/FMN-containing dehydrogenase